MTRLKILIVDDDYTAVSFVEMLARALGHDTAYCLDGRDAPEAVRAEKPDAVLLDLQMPDMDGLAVLSALKASAETRGVPVILHSGLADDPRVGIALRNGAAGFLKKPSTEAGLAAALAAVLKGKGGS